MLNGRRALLIISGGIAAYKSLELIRRLRERRIRVRTILTAGGARFVTPLSASAIAHETCYTDLFSLTEEREMGHLRLGREADLVVIAPASADILAKFANGIADDLATTVLLATDKPVLIAPAMNSRMWESAATQRNVTRLEANGVMRIGPASGSLAEGEVGPGRMAEPMDILAAIENHFARPGRLTGRRALVTSGPTIEPIDPVRFIANRSSGKQGHAIAAACAQLGAGVTLVAGPTIESDPEGVEVVHVESAREMLAACNAALPVDIAICAAAVADWRVRETSDRKLKKGAPTEGANRLPRLELVENPDILATLSRRSMSRPRLVVGFAAETERLVENATRKLAEKGCDWIVANDVSPESGTFGGETNRVHLIAADGGAPQIEDWPPLTKIEVAERLSERIADALSIAGEG